MLTFDLSSSYLGFKTLNARRLIKRWFTITIDIIYASPLFSHIILIKNSSRVWSLFALETLIHLGILCAFFNKFLQHLIKYFKGYFILHHSAHIWSSMSPKNQENVNLAIWFMVIDQRKSTSQNLSSLHHIYYKKNFSQISTSKPQALSPLSMEREHLAETHIHWQLDRKNVLLTIIRG